MPEEITACSPISWRPCCSRRPPTPRTQREGIAPERIHCVGNVMIDSLLHALPRARAGRAWERFGLQPAGYALITLHRPSNVDERRCCGISSRSWTGSRTGCRCCSQCIRARKMTGVRPRTAADSTVDPVGYLDFIGLESARLVTRPGDAEETTSDPLHLACQHRTAHHREPGTIHLARRASGRSGEILARQLLPRAVEKWDGHAAERILAVFDAYFMARG
jgi:UDP-N-acetylglucosamine 2-epimerase (non-hydrolysing)